MSSTGPKVISYEDLKKLIDKGEDFLLVDVRNKDEVAQGCIPGSVHIPIDTVDAALAMEPDAFMAKYGVTKPALDTPVMVFHCQKGFRGARGALKAYEFGYTNASNYEGAYEEWVEKEGR